MAATYTDSDIAEGSGVSSITLSALGTSGSDRLVSSVYGNRNNSTRFSAMTVDGNAMTAWSIGQTALANGETRVFYLGEAALNAGATQDVVGSTTNNQTFMVGAISHAGVEDQAPESVKVEALQGQSTSTSDTDDTVTDGALAVGILFFETGVISLARSGNDFTQRSVIDPGTNVAGEMADIVEAGAAPDTLTIAYQWSGSEDVYTHIMIFEAAAAAAAGSLLLMAKTMRDYCRR